MTREETHIKLADLAWADRYPENEIDVLINKIFDDFESRTCENCKWRDTNHAGDMFWCDNEVVNQYRTMNMRVEKDFGCNKFERKIDD